MKNLIRSMLMGIVGVVVCLSCAASASAQIETNDGGLLVCYVSAQDLKSPVQKHFESAELMSTTNTKIIKADNQSVLADKLYSSMYSVDGDDDRLGRLLKKRREWKYDNYRLKKTLANRIIKVTAHVGIIPREATQEGDGQESRVSSAVGVRVQTNPSANSLWAAEILVPASKQVRGQSGTGAWIYARYRTDFKFPFWE